MYRYVSVCILSPQTVCSKVKPRNIDVSSHLFPASSLSPSPPHPQTSWRPTHMAQCCPLKALWWLPFLAPGRPPALCQPSRRGPRPSDEHSGLCLGCGFHHGRASIRGPLLSKFPDELWARRCRQEQPLPSIPDYSGWYSGGTLDLGSAKRGLPSRVPSLPLSLEKPPPPIPAAAPLPGILF